MYKRKKVYSMSVEQTSGRQGRKSRAKRTQMFLSVEWPCPDRNAKAQELFLTVHIVINFQIKFISGENCALNVIGHNNGHYRAQMLFTININVWGKQSPPLAVFPKTKSQINSLLSLGLIHSDIPLTMLLLKIITSKY